MKLEIIIITYNRSKYLDRTLEFLADSVLKNYKITILDNCSVDDTSSIISKWLGKMPNMMYIRHKNNIGLGANIIRALEISDSAYTWVLCDDDTLNLSKFDDVLKIIEDEKVELIHVGGHYQKVWAMGGQLASIKHLIKNGYPYFKFSSFLPTNIFKTDVFQKQHLIAGYANVSNAYPHMPYLFSLYENDSAIYISKSQCVIAKGDGQSYNYKTWLFWWMRTCELLKNPEDAKLAFLDQWNNINETGYHWAMVALADFQEKYKRNSYLKYFTKRYLNSGDKKYLNKILYGRFKARIKSKLKTILFINK